MLITDEMARVAIFIPTYKRAYRLEKVYLDLEASTTFPVHVFFICENSDEESKKEVERLKNLNGVPRPISLIINKNEPSYAGAINTAYNETKDDFFFVGADDLHFHNYWLEVAMLAGVEAFVKKKTDTYVVGTNDLLNRAVKKGEHATHYLVLRKYIEKYGGTVDKSYPVLYPYKHNYCDTEFIETAKARGVFVPCLESIVEHMHHEAEKADFDETYRKGQLTVKGDRETYRKRKHLWKNIK